MIDDSASNFFTGMGIYLPNVTIYSWLCQ